MLSSLAPLLNIAFPSFPKFHFLKIFNCFSYGIFAPVHQSTYKSWGLGWCCDHDLNLIGIRKLSNAEIAYDMIITLL